MPRIAESATRSTPNAPGMTIRSLPRAFEFVKTMRAQGLEWGEGYLGLGREAIAAILQGQIAQAIDGISIGCSGRKRPTGTQPLLSASSADRARRY
jgi:hypothetical protein